MQSSCLIVMLQRVRNVVESFFEWSGLGLYKAFGPDPSRAFSFMNRTEGEEEAQLLVVQLWSSGSRMIFYSGSHLQSLPAKAAPTGLLGIDPNRLNIAGIKAIEVDMNYGGM